MSAPLRAAPSALAAAYGIAVTGTMAITTLLFYVVARQRWQWPRSRALATAGLFLAVDLAFLGSRRAAGCRSRSPCCSTC